jgi:hypothetical protein
MEIKIFCNRVRIVSLVNGRRHLTYSTGQAEVGASKNKSDAATFHPLSTKLSPPADKKN